MAYIYLFLIISLLIAIAPSLIRIFLIIWLVSLVLNLFRPKRKQHFNQREFHEEPTDNQSTYQRKTNSDIIDVEFTQRDAKPDSE